MNNFFLLRKGHLPFIGKQTILTYLTNIQFKNIYYVENKNQFIIHIRKCEEKRTLELKIIYFWL